MHLVSGCASSAAASHEFQLYCLVMQSVVIPALILTPADMLVTEAILLQR